MQVPWWVHSDWAPQAGPWALLVQGFVMMDFRPVLAPRHLRRSFQPQLGTLYGQDSASHHCVWPPLRVGSQHMKRTLYDGLDWGLKVRQQLPQTHFHMFKSMSSSKFTELCNYWYYHNPILENCHLPKRTPHACWQLIAFPQLAPGQCVCCVSFSSPSPGPSVYFPVYTEQRGHPRFPAKDSAYTISHLVEAGHKCIHVCTHTHAHARTHTHTHTTQGTM